MHVAEPDHFVQSLLDALPIGAAVYGTDLTLLGENRRLRGPWSGAARALLDDVLACGETRTATLQSGAADDPHWQDLRCTPLRHPDGRLRALLLTGEDASERHLAARVLGRQEQAMRDVLDTLCIRVWLLAPDGTLLGASKHTGLPPGMTCGQHFADAPLWAGLPAARDRIAAAIDGARAGHEARFETDAWLDGRHVTLDFMLAPLRSAGGAITHLVPSAIDISDRKQTEAALTAREAHFRQVVESTPDGLMMVDRSRTIRLVNHRLEALFGYARDELIGECFDRLLPDHVRDGHATLADGFYRAPEARMMATREPLFARRRDGSTFPCEIGLNPLQLDGETLVLASITDITERHRARQQIEQALAEKTILLGEVHHRVKNNLQVISSLLSLQARNAPDSIRAALQDCQQRVKSMALIHQLLYERNDFSGIPLGTYLQRLLRLLQQSLARPDRDIRLQFEPPEPELHLGLQDSIPFGLLVCELVGNACKHAFEGRGQGGIAVTLGTDGQQVQLTIEDDGRGLPDGAWPGTGAGLGFQLVQMLAGQLHGHLVLEGTTRGCRFVLRFTPGTERDA